MKFANAFTVGAGLAAGALVVAAIFKARPQTTGNVSSTPDSVSSSVQGPLYNVLTGVGGITPIQQHPDTTGSSIAPTNPS